jgi:amino acid transporter
MNQPPLAGSAALRKATGVIIITSVMFTFISYWRTAAVVLCDIASTVYYIGGIVESAVGPAAPWFILAVMLFSYTVRSVYIESCSLFVRGGVYRIVKEAMGGTLAKFSVSALLFDYLLTGPISGVSAGQYIMGLGLQLFRYATPELSDGLGLTGDFADEVKRWGAVLVAVAVTLYFFRQNLLGLHESSDKALKIMIATTVMAVIMIGWCGITLAVKGPVNDVPWTPDLSKKWQHLEIDAKDAPDPTRFTPEEDKVWIKDPTSPDGLKPALDDNGQPIPRRSEALHKVGIEAQDDPLGFLGFFTFGNVLRSIGVLGLLIAFAHSILAMSGEETLAQVYREVEAPKMLNFKRAAFIVFVYSIVLTAGVSFLAVMLIPDEVRMKFYSENLISGLARHVIGPAPLLLLLEGFVVIVGFLILSGAVNTAIIGSNGVLNRIAEDGVLPDWFLKPHPKFGTTSRLLILIAALQVGVIFLSRGDMIVLGEAYAFGVVWSFTFKALAMVVLRFRDPRPREYRVPFNFTIGKVEFPVGLMLIFAVLLITALLNLFTKPVATVAGLTFASVFFVIFLLSERHHEKKKQGESHTHLEQFNQASEEQLSPESLLLAKPYRKLVAIRSTQNLHMLEKALADTDPGATDVIVMTAKVTAQGEANMDSGMIERYDQELMTAVVEYAEHAGKQVHPLIVPTNNAVYAVLRTAKDLRVHELVIGGSNKFTADEQLDQVSLLWITLHGGDTAPLTVRIVSKDRDLHFDISGGNRIPRAGEANARSIADLRDAGIGTDRVLLVQHDSRAGLDMYQAILTTLDPAVELKVLVMPPEGELQPADALHVIQEQSRQLARAVTVGTLGSNAGADVVQQANSGGYDVIVLPFPDEADRAKPLVMPTWVQHVVQHARCRVLLTVNPLVPRELAD